MMPPLNWRRNRCRLTIIVVKADKRAVGTVEVSGSVQEGAERFEFCVRKAVN
jgi:hypothetical protein